MDFETISADDFGRSLTGIGLNILVRDVKAEAAFLAFFPPAFFSSTGSPRDTGLTNPLRSPSAKASSFLERS